MSDNLDFLGAAGNLISSVGGAFFENTLGRQNEERQWNKYYSPKAQVENLAAAGINPAVAMGNQSPVLTSGGQMQMPQVSPFGIGTTALSDIGNYLNAKALAAKTEKETGKVDVETRKALSELEAQNLQNDLVRQFGKQKWTYDVAQAYQNVLLAQKTNDIKEQEKSMNEYRKVTNYLESVLKGDELTAFRKRLGNLDREIALSNKLQSEKINTEKSQQGALAASAENQRSQANYNRESARLQRALADIEESGKSFKLESLLKHYRASGMLDDASYEKAYKLYKNLASINRDNDEHSWNQAADDLFYYLGEKIHQISPIGSMLDIDYSKK